MRYIYILFLIVKYLNLCLSISKEMIRNIYNNSEIYLKIKELGINNYYLHLLKMNLLKLL